MVVEQALSLTTGNGALIVLRCADRVNQVDVYRRTTAGKEESLGFLLCVSPHTRTLHGKLTDNEYRVLQRTLTIVQAWRRIKDAAGVLEGAAADLEEGGGTAPEVQQAAGLLRASKSRGAVVSALFEPAPGVVIRTHQPDGNGFSWSNVLGNQDAGAGGSDPVWTAEGEAAFLGIGQGADPFEQTPEQEALLQYIEAQGGGEHVSRP